MVMAICYVHIFFHYKYGHFLCNNRRDEMNELKGAHIVALHEGKQPVQSCQSEY